MSDHQHIHIHQHTDMPLPRPIHHQPVSITRYRQCGIARRYIKTVGNKFELPRVSTEISARHRHACVIQREQLSLETSQLHAGQTSCTCAASSGAQSQTGSPWDVQHSLHTYNSCNFASWPKQGVVACSSHPESGMRSQCPTAVVVVVLAALVVPAE